MLTIFKESVSIDSSDSFGFEHYKQTLHVINVRQMAPL